MPTPSWSLNEQDVAIALRTAVDAARTRGIAVTVAVVDGSGNLLGQTWMDGAKLPSTHVAACKAWTAALFQRPSGDYAESTAPGGGAFAMWNAFPGKFTPVSGGKPVIHAGVCIGAVGVSGGSGQDDLQLADAAAASIAAQAGR